MVIDVLSLVVSFLAVITSTVLTIFIIVQTNKNTKDQTKLQKQLTQQQIDFETKQLQMQQRPDRMEAFKTVFKVYRFVEGLQTAKNVIQKTLAYETIGGCFDICKEQLGISVEEINLDLFLGELVVSPHVKPTLEKIRILFWKINEHMFIFTSKLICLTEEEKEKDKERLDLIWNWVDDIHKTRRYIESIIDSEISL